MKSKPSDPCSALVILQAAGMSKTAHRLRILDILIQAERPLTANDILERTDPRKKINKVTVYRILSSFKEEGIVREFQTDQGGNRFEMACQHNPIHPHFHCKNCRDISCLPPVTLSQVWELFSEPHNLKLESINIHMTGLCQKCWRKN